MAAAVRCAGIQHGWAAMRCNWAGLDSHKNVGQSVCECGSISPRESQVVGVRERKLGDNFTVIFGPTYSGSDCTR